MDFHEWDAWHLMMVNVRADGQTVAHTSDLETLPQRWESKGIGGAEHMVRMFRRLLRGSGRQRVTGVWIV